MVAQGGLYPHECRTIVFFNLFNTQTMSKYLIIIYLASCSTLWSQITPVTSTEKTPFIEVLGKGKNEVEPDLIYLFIRLSKTTVNREEITVEMQESRLKLAL
jgi:hypothetical protein